jgi:acyl-CoA thioester hydrolase
MVAPSIIDSTASRANIAQERQRHVSSPQQLHILFLVRAHSNVRWDVTDSPRFDSVVNTYLIKHCALHPPTSSQIGLVVHSHCDYFAPVEFPAVVDLALRVNKLGKSSVTYEIGVFERCQEEVKAVGEFIHVFVDRESRRPDGDGMADALKVGLEKLSVQGIQRQSKL